PAGVHVGNGFGKLTGTTQIRELGNIETPIVLTNTLSIPTGANDLLTFTSSQEKNEGVRSINPIVGETNDGYLNDIRGRHVTEQDVLQAIRQANAGAIKQGNAGAGTGTTALGFKGGIGTSSRKLPDHLGGYTVGVLVQTNFGGVLQVAGLPVGKILNKYYLSGELNTSPDGSIMIVVATDAPLSPRNLERLAKRTMLGMAKTGGIVSDGSAAYAIACSTARALRIPYHSEAPFKRKKVLSNDALSPLFLAAEEATEEAILNSLFHAEAMTGRDGHKVEALPVNRILSILKEHNRLE